MESTGSQVPQDTNKNPVPVAPVASTKHSAHHRESIVGSNLEEASQQAKKKSGNFHSEASELLELPKLKLQPKVEGEPGIMTTRQSLQKETKQEGEEPAQKRLKVEKVQEAPCFRREENEHPERAKYVSPERQNKLARKPEVVCQELVSHDGDEPVFINETFGNDRTYNQTCEPEQYFSPSRPPILPWTIGQPNFNGVTDAKFESGESKQQQQHFEQQRQDQSVHRANFLPNQPRKVESNRAMHNKKLRSMAVWTQQEQQLPAANNQTRRGRRRLEDIPLWPGADVCLDHPTSHRPVEILDHRQQQPMTQDQYYSMGLDKRGRKLPKGRPRGGGAFRQWIKNTRGCQQ